MKLIFGLVISLIVSGWSATVHACDCDRVTATEAMKQAEALFIGKVSTETRPNREWLVNVDGRLKGDVADRIRLVAAAPNSSCELSDFRVGETYVFFADFNSRQSVLKRFSNSIPTDQEYLIDTYEPIVCSRTSLLRVWETDLNESEREFVKILKNAKKPKTKKS